MLYVFLILKPFHLVDFEWGVTNGRCSAAGPSRYSRSLAEAMLRTEEAAPLVPRTGSPCRHRERSMSSLVTRHSSIRCGDHPSWSLIEKIEKLIPLFQNVLKALQPSRRIHFHNLRSRAHNNQTLKADWPIHSLQGPKPTTKSNALKAAGPSHSFQTLIERKAKGKTFKAAGPSHPFQALVELAPEGKHNACANLSP